MTAVVTLLATRYIVCGRLKASANVVDPAILAKLAALKAQPKFVDEPGTIYNGMHPEEMRQLAEAQLNNLIERLMYAPRG